MASLKYSANEQLQTVTLASAYTASSGTMSLTAGHGARLPASGDFWLRTTSGTYRCFKVTARSTDTLTVVAAQDGTSDGNLDADTELKWILGVAAFDQFRQDIIQSGAYASLPAGEKAGQIYIPTDSAYDLLRYSGSAWQHFKQGKLLTPPVLADFTWYNQSTATGVNTRGGIYMYDPAHNGDNFRILTKAVPAAPYTIVAAFVPELIALDYHNTGLILQETSSGKLVTYGFTHNSGDWKLVTDKYNSYSSWNANYANYAIKYQPHLIYLKIEDNNTNRILSYSVDGITYHILYSGSRTDFITPDRIGFQLNANYTSHNAASHFIHWVES